MWPSTVLFVSFSSIFERGLLIPKRTSCVGLFKVRSKHLLEYPNISPQFPPPCLGELGGRGVGGLAHRSPLHTLWPVDDGKTSYKAREMTPLLPQRRESLYLKQPWVELCFYSGVKTLHRRWVANNNKALHLDLDPPRLCKWAPTGF